MKVELLAPAGNFESLIAAVESGSDAVYIGGRKYSARALAENFTEEEIIKAVEYAHIRNVKIYLTVNTLLTDEELVDALEYVQFLYNNDVDGIIVQDIGLLYWIKKYFPDMPVHCSTQMTIHNKDAVEILRKLGADRFVLAREMNIGEIKNLIESTNAETEIFVHGALCVSYSGQCLMSSFIGGRSGNRGRCAQPCRKEYKLVKLENGSNLNVEKKGYLLSLKDLNTIKYIDKIIKCGVKSLKIEGRMKKPEYVGIVVKHYRDILNQAEIKGSVAIDNDVERELEIAFNREFTHGFLFNESKHKIVNISKPNNRGIYLGKLLWQKGNRVAILIENDILNKGDGIEIISDNGTSIGAIISNIQKQYDNTVIININRKLIPGSIVYKTFDLELSKKACEQYFYVNKRKVSLNARLYAQIGSKLRIDIWDNEGHRVEVENPYIIKEAEKVAITKDRIINQLVKTGDTPYIFEKIDVNMDDDIFIPVSILNEIRREALKKMDKVLSCRNERRYCNYSKEDFISGFTPEKHVGVNEFYFSASVWDYNNVKAAIEGGADYIYYGSTDRIKEAIELCHRNNKVIYFFLPSIIKDGEKDKYKKIIEENDLDGIVISNISQLRIADIKPGMTVVGNFSLNVFNKRSLDLYLKLGVNIICPSVELNIKQLKSIAYNYGPSMELVVYGQLPLMTLEYCPVSLISECKDCSYQRVYGLKDDKGFIFPIICRQHKVQLLNSHVLFVAEDMGKIASIGVRRMRLDFYRENSKDVKEIISLYRNHKNLDRCSHHEIIEKIKKTGHTKGHYFRGVD